MTVVWEFKVRERDEGLETQDWLVLATFDIAFNFEAEDGQRKEFNLMPWAGERFIHVEAAGEAAEAIEFDNGVKVTVRFQKQYDEILDGELKVRRNYQS